jgi:hypothetical protein
VNGGAVILCKACDNRGACGLCLNYDLEDEDEDEEIPFYCPSCFKKEKGNEPYVSNFLQIHIKFTLKTYKPFKLGCKTSIRENWPIINVEKLAIVSIHLQGMRDTPASVTFEILQPYLRGNLVFFDVQFNLLDEETSVGFWVAMEALLNDLEKDLKEYV